MAPYTNITKPQELNMKTLKQSWGIFPYIVNDGVQFCCRSCAAHGTSTVDFTRNEHGQPSEVMGNGELMRSIDGSTDLTFPAYGYLEMTLFHSQYKYTPLVESPGSAFVVRKEKSSISGILMSNIMGTWSLLVMMICLALLAGTIIWILVSMS